MPSKYLFGNFHRLLPPQFPPILLWGDSLPAPVETERLRSLVTHVGSIGSLGLFNAVAAVLQKPNATAVLPENQWRRFGLEPKPDAFPIAIASMKGPIDFAYDISDTQPLALPNKKAWEVSVDKLHGPRYWCGKIRAWESASEVMKKFGVEIDVQPTWETLLNEKAIGYAVHVEAGQWTFEEMRKTRHGRISSSRIPRISVSLSIRPCLAKNSRGVKRAPLSTPQWRCSSFVHASNGTSPSPLADEFMRDDSALPPKGVSVVTILQIAHFLEQRVLLRKDLALPALASKEDPESGSEDAGS